MSEVGSVEQVNGVTRPGLQLLLGRAEAQLTGSGLCPGVEAHTTRAYEHETSCLSMATLGNASSPF